MTGWQITGQRAQESPEAGSPSSQRASTAAVKNRQWFCGLVGAECQKTKKMVDGALSSLHEAIAAIMGPLGAAWVSLEQMCKEDTAADPATLLRNVQMAVCLLGQALWKTTNRRRLLWLAKFLGDFKKAATFLKEEESATTESGKKLFRWAFLKRLYRRAKGKKQASMIKSVLGASKKSKKLRWDAKPRQPQPFRANGKCATRTSKSINKTTRSAGAETMGRSNNAPMGAHGFGMWTGRWVFTEVSEKLGSGHKRPRDISNGARGKDSVCTDAHVDRAKTGGPSIQPRRVAGVWSRSPKTDRKTGNRNGGKCRTRVPRTPVLASKERRVDETSVQSKTTKCVRDLSALQDGGHGNGDEHDRTGWLVLQDRPEGRLFAIPIHPDHRKYLRFIWKDQVYQCRALPFGLASGPRIFIKLLKPAIALLQRVELRMV